MDQRDAEQQDRRQEQPGQGHRGDRAPPEAEDDQQGGREEERRGQGQRLSEVEDVPAGGGGDPGDLELLPERDRDQGRDRDQADGGRQGPLPQR
ncbi:MAG: hypothetical protein ABIS86_09275 [Streptosporangiaceae bacterium]